MGMLSYGTADEPEEEQIRQGLESLQKERAAQLAFRTAIQALREKQRGFTPKPDVVE